jgi:GAF domain-containing protein
MNSQRFRREIFQPLEKESPSPQSLLEHLTRSLHSDRGMLLSCSEESCRARVLAAANVREPNLTLEEFQISRTVFREVLRSGQGVLIKNPLDDRAYADQTSILHGRIQSILAGAVRSQKKVIGILLVTAKLHRLLSRHQLLRDQPGGCRASTGRGLSM